ERAAHEPEVTEARGSVPDRQHLGVGGGVAVDLAPVVGRGEHPPVGVENQRTDGDVATRRGVGGELEGGVHRHGPGGHGLHPARRRRVTGTFYPCACTSRTTRSSPTS